MSLYIPNPGDMLTENTAWKWYSNISAEIDSAFLDDKQRNHMMSYYYEAGLLRAWRSPFFRYHYARTFAAASSFLLPTSESQPLILDLGCGTGTQSIAFALLGANVISLDMDNLALDILKKRKSFYEEQAGRCLNIRVLNADVMQVDYNLYAPIDGIYSLFAFNLMQPSFRLLSTIVPHMSDKGRIVLLDGNRLSWVSRLLPWRRRSVLSPLEMTDTLNKFNFEVVDHHGGVVFPPIFWSSAPYAALSRLDHWLGRKSWFFPVSHQIYAARS